VEPVQALAPEPVQVQVAPEQEQELVAEAVQALALVQVALELVAEVLVPQEILYKNFTKELHYG
jgi:hypothetical protein